MDVHEMARGVAFRDDEGASEHLPHRTVDTFSPHAHRDALAASGAAIYSYSGWRDGGYPRSAVERFLRVSTPGSRLTLGPWVHSGRLRIRPFGVAAPAAFDHDAELLSFFDAALRGRAPRGDGRPVHYYTHVAGAWRAADAWPPPSTPSTWFVGPGRALWTEAAPEASADAHYDPGTRGTGERSRWRSLLSLVPGDYPDRAARDARILVYDSPPLEDDLEVTGHPLAVLHVSFDHDDGRLFVYLEDVAPDGRVAYVTEGCLRAIHRAHEDDPELPWPRRTYRREHGRPLPAGEVAELAIGLLPISWLFRRRHRIRLAVAGSDADHFGPSPVGRLRVHRGPAHPSRLVLPTVERRG